MTLKPGVPPALNAAVAKALQKDPKDRFASAGDLAHALEVLLQNAAYDQGQFCRHLQEHAPTDIAPAPQGALSGAAGGTQRQFTLQRGAPKTLPQLPAAPSRPPAPLAPPATVPASGERTQTLLRALAREANLWTLTALGAHHFHTHNPVLAASAWRVAAAAFAHRGLLVQAFIVHDRASKLIPERTWHQDILTLGMLGRGDHAALLAYMASVDQGGFFDILRTADPATYGPAVDRTRVIPPVPLFGLVLGDALAHLIRCTRVRHYPPGSMILAEGEVGDTLYGVGEGRVVVFCNPPEGTQVPGGRIYISSLSEGDFFGEFGFLAGGVRSASVEAVQDTFVLEVDRKDVRHLIKQHPAIHGPLMDFYKARVVELLMAKNPVFAALPANERRLLLGRAVLQQHEDGAVIIEEGGVGDAFYFIKQGEVEVLTHASGVPVFINKLKEGEFFGEMAVLRGTPRTASVRAMGPVEVLHISAQNLGEVLRMQPEVRAAMETAAVARLEETAAQLRSTAELLRQL